MHISSRPGALCLPPCCADVTRRASQLLLAHRGLLTPPQLARLAAKMAEVGMSSELKDLVQSSVASGSHAGQAVGFVAAALTGERRSCQNIVERLALGPGLAKCWLQCETIASLAWFCKDKLHARQYRLGSS